ncbi:Stealth CR1 domain-containing protein [Kitasatospora sp. NPDC048540]|uniref:Stealth CR1 domain-containing protein n=1 Tax=Kitasatospora sp. NPDC048540 TaxID=3155634 RepID=UPI0033F3DC7C
MRRLSAVPTTSAWRRVLHRRAAAPTTAGPAAPPPGPPTREDELLAARPALVRDRGLLAEVREELAPHAVRAANLALAAQALLAAGVPYALVPDARRPEEPERHHLAVRADRRARVLVALDTAFTGRHVYLEPVGWGAGPGPLLAPGLQEAVDRHERPGAAAGDEGDGDDGDDGGAAQRLVRGVRVFRPVVAASRTLGYGADQGCEIKFWQPAEPSGGAIVPYGSTLAGWWAPSLEPAATVRIAGGRHPVPAAFTRRPVDEVDFPVDAVYTWVDDTDPRWRERRERRAAEATPAAGPGPGFGPGAGPGTGTEPQRFRNRDELRYSLRSLAAHAPWIRRVHLVTDDQRPAWLDTAHPGIHVVAHRELFDDPGLLPVFNSRAIESQLHRIDGLSEHFVYFNDDVFLGRELGPGFFFQSNGVARLFQDGVIPPDPVRPGEDSYVAGQKNTRDAIARRHGRVPTRTLGHTPRAAHRSLLAHNAQEFAAEYARTAAEPFRGHASLSPLTLYAYTAYLAGRAVFAEPDECFVDIGRPESLALLQGLAERRDAAVFCLNDVTTGLIDPAAQDAAVRAFLDGYFPAPGPYELRRPLLPRPAAGPDRVLSGRTEV